MKDFTRHTHTHTRITHIRPQREARPGACLRAQCPAPRDHPTPEPRRDQEARRRRGALNENDRLTFLAGAGEGIPSASPPHPTTTPASACATRPPEAWSCSMSDGTPGVLLWRDLRPKEKERLTLPTPPPGRLTEAGSEGGGPGVGGTAAASGASGGLGLRERMPKECARTRRGGGAAAAVTSATAVSGVASAASVRGASMKEPPTAEPRRESDCKRGLRRCGATPGRLA
mmetsp:Transcript_73561/g.177506  ORF Transcript_73561/g.177506 Transcript_73561/m.177506 type:complete len:230 (-) Transcript_73561:1554-2243(-)